MARRPSEQQSNPVDHLRRFLAQREGPARLVLSTDWSRTPLGPMEAWPRTLLAYVQMIFELPSAAIIFWGPEQTQIYNAGYAQIMGPRHPRYFGAPYSESWPDTYPVIYPWMRRVLDDGEVVRVDETEITVTRYGFEEEAYFSFTFSPLRDDEGRIAGILQPVQEVTEAVLSRRRAATLHDLRPEREAADPVGRALATLAENRRDLPVAIVYLLDAVTGALQPVGSSPRELVSRGGDERLCTEVQRSLETGEAVIIDRLDEILGSEVGPWPEPPRRAIAIPLSSGELSPRGVALLGISPRLHLDEAYRTFLDRAASHIGTAIATSVQNGHIREAAQRERTQLFALFEQAPVAVAILSGPDHVFQLANAPYSDLVGRRDVLRRPIREAFPEVEGQGLLEILDRVYRTGEPFIGNEMSVRLAREPDAVPEEHLFNFVYQPFRNLDGAVEGIMVFAFEVTAEVRVRHALEEARANAESANRAKDQFLAILGHELRNPLAPILTALQVMRLRGDPALDRERAVIERQATHLVRLVDDLLDVSRIARGRVTLKREPVELAEVTARAIEMASPAIEERQHRLVVDVPQRGLAVHADPARMAQVIANLLTNAAKYTERAGTIIVHARRDGDEAVLGVVDDGMGIDAAELPHIFEMFEQEHQSLDRSRGGLGLGLTIVRSLLEMHGGSVAAYSEGRGLGSRFEVRLPALAIGGERSAFEQTPGLALHPAPDGLRILIVDDNRDFAELLAESLTAFGHATRVTHDGPTALRVAAEFEPEVAVLDLGLPAMDGYELARRLHAIPGLAELPLVAVSGYGQESDRRRSRDAGFDDHLVKPIEVERLDQLLRALPQDGASDSAARSPS